MKILILACTFVVYCGIPVHAQNQSEPKENITMLFARFAGEEQLGTNVANLVRLQVSSTFREADTGNRGRMIWREEPIVSHEEGLERGLSLTGFAHLVIWGDVYTLQDGVALQAYLSVTERFWRRGTGETPPPGVWQIAVPNDDNPDQTIVLGLPRSLYRLPPVLYSEEAAANYTSLDGLPIYDDQNFSTVIGRTKTLYRAFQYTDDAVFLTSEGVTGWVPLDFVSDENNLMVQFAGAVFRIIRGDYSGARANLDDVLKSELLDLSLRVDALLIYGLSLELEGQSGLTWFSLARELSPISAIAARYYLAGTIQSMERGDSDAALRQELQSAIAEAERLFSPDSRWFAAVRQYANATNLEQQ